MTTALIIGAVLLILVFIIAGMYNNLVRLRNNRENAFANIDVQLQQRYDLIPNLVSTVKGYAAHEKETLENITKARSAYSSATNINDKIQADQQMTQALANLKVTVEAYPDLKANENFLSLQTELSDIENKLAAVRRFFNSATREYNNAVEVFPANIFAGMFGFRREPMYEISASERATVSKAPQVSF